MQETFQNVLQMSLTSSVAALAVMAIRLIFRKAPKWTFCLMWGLVALRLICPASVESAVSLVPDRIASGQLVSNIADAPMWVLPEQDMYFDSVPEDSLESALPTEDYHFYEAPLQPAPTVGETLFPALSWGWMTGMMLMLAYTAFSYIALKRKLREATLLRENIWQCGQVDSPFVLGFLRPRIYLPYRISESDMEHVIAHERSHIRRKDHWWKPLGFLLLSIHWFNPVLWIAYVLLCRDIESACDEKVIRDMEKAEKQAYSTALLHCSIHRRRIAACPLAFGEVGVKERVKYVMGFRKPAFWVVLIAVAVCLIVAVCFLTNPSTDVESPEFGYYLTIGAENVSTIQITTTTQQTTIYREYRKPFEKGMTIQILMPGRSSLRGISVTATDAENKEIWAADITSEEHDEPMDVYTSGEWIITPVRSEEELTGLNVDPNLSLYNEIANIDLGLDLSVLKSTATGVQLRVTQSGIQPAGALYAAGFTLTGRGENGGYHIIYPSSDGDIDPKTVKLNLDDTTEWTWDWSDVYGELPPGEYDLFLVVSCFLEEDVRDSQLMETHFTISEDTTLQFTGELIPDTYYVPHKCLYMNPLSSYYPLGGDSGCRYLVTEDSFVTFWRNQHNFVSVTNPELDTAGEAANNIIPVTQWEWREFPFTDEAWSNLYFPSIQQVVNISSAFDEMLYQPLTSGKFLLKMDQELWLVELSGSPKTGPYLWSIYSLVPESAMGSARWEYAPESGSLCPYFRFEFDMDYQEISAVCVDSPLVDYDSAGAPSDASLTLGAGDALYWSPVDEDGNLVTYATIHFTVYDGETPRSGTIYLERSGGSDERSVYTASIVGTNLYLAPNAAQDGGVICVRDSSNDSPVLEYSQTRDEIEVRELDIRDYLFYKGSEQISFQANGTDLVEPSNLLNIMQNHSLPTARLRPIG